MTACWDTLPDWLLLSSCTDVTYLPNWCLVLVPGIREPV